MALTVATGEPFVRNFADELEKILKLSVKFVFSNPQDVKRYLAEFYDLAKNELRMPRDRSGFLPKAAELDATGLMPYLCAVCDRFCAR
jgi:general secretion pathway protein E